jgi:alpha-galactosidase
MHQTLQSWLAKGLLLRVIIAGWVLVAWLGLPKALSAADPSPQELAWARDWQTSLFPPLRSSSKSPPFSFSYGGKGSAELLKEWKVGSIPEIQQGKKVRQFIQYMDPVTGLEFTCELDFYLDFPAIEWQLHYKNSGAASTPILENIEPLDLKIARGPREFVLHHAKGANNEPTDFIPMKHVLSEGTQLQLKPVGGSSSHTVALPFFNLEPGIDSGRSGLPGTTGGSIIGIGWTGQWEASFNSDSRFLHLRAGMERTHLRLLPGETIRSPRIMVLFWQGEDPIRGHNLLRSFILKYHTPRPAGKLPEVPVAAMPWWQFDYGNQATSDNQIELASLYRQKRLSVDTYWLDAGWFEGGWPNGAGNWFPKKEAFPNGLRPLSDAVHQMGMKLVVWFEPERVVPGTWLDLHHPEWLFGKGQAKLLNLGNVEAKSWLTDHISRMIGEQGIDIYRQDTSLDPLSYWQEADAPDRQGMTEIRFIEGLYDFWDELLKSHPHLLIDNAASGGRRIDLETLSRSLPLWRFDYFGGEMSAFQSHGAGLALYVPLSSTGVPPTKNNPNAELPDRYITRSGMSSGIPLTWNLRRPDFDDSQAREILDEIHSIKRYYQGDFYPLTEITAEETRWLTYQYDRPDLGEGMVMGFRRRKCPEPVLTVKLRGLMSSARYEVKDRDTQRQWVATGAELARGLQLKSSEEPSSVLLTYQRKK